MDTDVELVGIKNGVGLFYEYSVGKESIDVKEIPLDRFKEKEYSCRNFSSRQDGVTLNGKRFSSIDTMITYTKSLEDADLKSKEHTKNGWYFF